MYRLKTLIGIIKNSCCGLNLQKGHYIPTYQVSHFLTKSEVTVSDFYIWNLVYFVSFMQNKTNQDLSSPRPPVVQLRDPEIVTLRSKFGRIACNFFVFRGINLLSIVFILYDWVLVVSLTHYICFRTEKLFPVQICIL